MNVDHSQDPYNQPHKMYVATDCIVFGFEEGQLKLLIFPRKTAPLQGQWSLIGSFVKLEEDLDIAARRVLKETTGLQNIYLEQSKTYGIVDRDPGFRCISVAYYALIRLEEHDRDSVRQFGAEWCDIQDLPSLVLDHEQMVGDALQKLQERARRRPLGFELLPEKFTLPQLQSLYEAIYQRTFDPRNFRKKVHSLNLLNKLDEKDKSSSKRGAFLYEFDHLKYQDSISAGFNFEL